MKRTSLLNAVLRRMGGGGVVALLAAGALGAAGQAVAGISTTKHNLSAGVAATKNGIDPAGGTTTTEICVFCHTPHGSDTSASVPLWNKVLGGGAGTYSSYSSLGTSSLDGEQLAVGSVSLACLSCHDGTQAMNVMLNTPGSGTLGSGTPFGTMIGPRVDGAGKLASTNIANLSKDLRNDHPIGIQYAGGPKSGTAPAMGAAYGPTLFNDADFAPALSTSANGRTVWWVETTAGGTTRDKNDMQLYTRDAGTDNLQPYVECASCHDPHSEKTTFLRIDNSASAVCLACHTK